MPSSINKEELRSWISSSRVNPGNDQQDTVRFLHHHHYTITLDCFRYTFPPVCCLRCLFFQIAAALGHDVIALCDILRHHNVIIFSASLRKRLALTVVVETSSSRTVVAEKLAAIALTENVAGVKVRRQSPWGRRQPSVKTTIKLREQVIRSLEET